MANRLVVSLFSVLRNPVLSSCRRPVVVLCTRNYGTRRESQPWKQRPNRKARLAIVLTEDIPNLGSKGQLVKVKHGYARNWLLPKKLAVYATPDNIEFYDAWEAEKGVDTGLNYADYLSEKTLTIERDPSLARCAVIEQDISTAFRKKFQLHVPLDCIELEKPISTFGEHSVGVRLDESTLVTVPVHVIHKSPRVRQKKKEDIIVQQLGI